MVPPHQHKNHPESGHLTPKDLFPSCSKAPCRTKCNAAEVSRRYKSMFLLPSCRRHPDAGQGQLGPQAVRAIVSATLASLQGGGGHADTQDLAGIYSTPTIHKSRARAGATASISRISSTIPAPLPSSSYPGPTPAQRARLLLSGNHCRSEEFLPSDTCCPSALSQFHQNGLLVPPLLQSSFFSFRVKA